MPGRHDAIIPVTQFWRTLAFVALGFGAALLLSWTIDANFPHRAVGASGETQSQMLSR